MSKEQLLGIKYSVKSKGELGKNTIWKIHSIENSQILQSYWSDHIETDEVDLWTGENTFGLEYTLFMEGYVHYEDGVLVVTGYETERDLYPITWEQPRPIVAMFYGDNCVHCENLKPIFKQLEKENPDLQFYQIDTQQDIVMTRNFEIKGLPTIITIKDGKEVNRIVGFKTKEELTTLIAKDKL